MRALLKAIVATVAPAAPVFADAVPGGCARAIVATVALAAPFYANAVPVEFDLAGGPKSYVKVTDFDPGFICLFCGIDVDLNSGLGNLHSSLDVGQSWTFDFFEISFFGIGGGTGTISA